MNKGCEQRALVFYRTHVYRLWSSCRFRSGNILKLYMPKCAYVPRSSDFCRILVRDGSSYKSD